MGGRLRSRLLLEVLHVGPVGLLHLLGVLRDDVGVRLGVPRDADAKVVAVLLPDVLDEVQGAAEAALDSREGLLPLGGVAAQRQDILEAVRLDLRPMTATTVMSDNDER